MRKLYLLLAIGFLTSCAPTYQVKNLAGTQGSVILSKQAGVYITIPANGQYEATTYPGSGQTVAQILADAFSKFAPKVILENRTTSGESAFTAAKSVDAQYVVIPMITHWEQRATEWSGIPSKVAIRVTIFDANSQKELTAVSIDGRSSIMTLSSTNPESMLKDPVSKYVSSLY